MITKNLLLWSACLSAVMLAGCTPTLKSDVVTFHENDLPKGETIRVEPVDDALRGSQEFAHYAKLVRDNLDKLGYTPVAGNQPATLIAELDYSVGKGQTEIKSEHRNYVRYHFFYDHYRFPYYYGMHYNWPPEIYAYTVYNRELRLNIVRPAPEREVLFEGRVQSIGRENDIAKVMPYMITAMFSNFPGESGVTKVVTIEKNH